MLFKDDFTFLKNEKTLFGDLAIITGIISFVPILFKMTKTKNTSNFTWGNLYLAIFSNIMWVLYGLSSNSITNIVSGILYFIIYFYISSIKFHN